MNYSRQSAREAYKTIEDMCTYPFALNSEDFNSRLANVRALLFDIELHGFDVGHSQALESIRSLHVKGVTTRGGQYSPYEQCTTCTTPWPCATLIAIEEQL